MRGQEKFDHLLISFCAFSFISFEIWNGFISKFLWTAILLAFFFTKNNSKLFLALKNFIFRVNLENIKDFEKNWNYCAFFQYAKFFNFTTLKMIQKYWQISWFLMIVNFFSRNWSKGNLKNWSILFLETLNESFQN